MLQMTISSLVLTDNKFFCFNGEVKTLLVRTERQSGNVKFDFFNSVFNQLDLILEHQMSGRQVENR